MSNNTENKMHIKDEKKERQAESYMSFWRDINPDHTKEELDNKWKEIYAWVSFTDKPLTDDVEYSRFLKRKFEIETQELRMKDNEAQFNNSGKRGKHSKGKSSNRKKKKRK